MSFSIKELDGMRKLHSEVSFRDFFREVRDRHPSTFSKLRAFSLPRKITIKGVFDLLYPDFEPVCGHCGKPTVWENGKYQQWCNRSCATKNTHERGAIKQAVQVKYGVDNVSQLSSVKRRKVATCQQNFGVDHPQQSKTVRATTIKAVRKMYGVDNVSGLPHVQAKRESTNLDRHGVANAMHNPAIFAKTMYNAHRIKSEKIGGKTFKYMGYENVFIRYLVNTLGVPVSDITTRESEIPRIAYLNEGRPATYYPDVKFTYEGRTWVVEVKSEWTGGLCKKNNRHPFKELRDKSLAACKRGRFAVVFIQERTGLMSTFKDFTNFNLRSVRSKVMSDWARQACALP